MSAKFRPQKIKRIVAGSLVVWLSGVAFFFCRAMPKAQAAAAESCPLAARAGNTGKARN